jgi:hypothetical protein
MLVFVTAGFVVLYAPVETAISWGQLSSPGYICDVIAFALLGYAVWHHRATAGGGSLAPLAASWGYCLALFWRCYFMRIYDEQQQLGIYAGEHPMVRWALVAMLVLAAAMLLSIMWAARRR